MFPASGPLGESPRMLRLLTFSGNTSSSGLFLPNHLWLMQTSLSISVGKVLHGDVEMLEVGREDPSDTESDTSHGGPGPDEPWVTDDTGESEGDGSGNGLIEEGEGVDETLHSGGRSSIGELVGGDVDEQLSNSRGRNDEDWQD